MINSKYTACSFTLVILCFITSVVELCKISSTDINYSHPEKKKKTDFTVLCNYMLEGQ